jgi:hypothetical protein
VVVGKIHSPFEHQGTWFGEYELSPSLTGTLGGQRVTEFIEFCRDFHDRAAEDPGDGPDPAEFDQFKDLLTSGLWTTHDPSGATKNIIQAPMFIDDKEISWIV